MVAELRPTEIERCQVRSAQAGSNKHHFVLIEQAALKSPREPRFDRARYQFGGILLHEMVGFWDGNERQVALHERPGVV